MRFIGAHGGCSCGFPSVIADSPIDDFEGMLIDSDEREADLRSVDALVELLRRILESSSSIEIYPVWDGDQAEPPKGVIEWQVGALVPERFFVNERFMHVVRP